MQEDTTSEEITAPEITPDITSITVDPDKLGDWGNDIRIIEPDMKLSDYETPEEDETGEDDDEIVDEDNVALPVVPAPLIDVEDPGEYVPKDYSFEVTVYDAEGKNGRAVKIESVDQFDKLLEDDANFGTAAALMKADRQAARLEASSERDKASHQEKKDKFDEAKKNGEADQAAAQMLVNEVNYLTERGDLPKVDAKYINADWNDPEVAKQPGVREQLEVINTMVRESNLRAKAGLPKVTSFLEGHRIWAEQQRTKRSTATKAKAGEARKAAGARVAGTTPSPTNATPAGLRVGRGGSLKDLGAQTNWDV